MAIKPKYDGRTSQTYDVTIAVEVLFDTKPSDFELRTALLTEVEARAGFMSPADFDLKLVDQTTGY